MESTPSGQTFNRNKMSGSSDSEEDKSSDEEVYFNPQDELGDEQFGFGMDEEDHEDDKYALITEMITQQSLSAA